MIVRADALDALQLINDGVRVVDVLPASTFAEEHLPGAINMPLATFYPEKLDAFDRSAPLLVYCFDQHCDLSGRAVARFDELGFERVHDLVGGRAAWTALGFPTEGSVADRRRISQYLAQAAAVSIDGTIGDLLALGEHHFPVPVTNGDGVVLGAVDPVAGGLPPDTRVADVMVSAPGTIRPELRIDEVVQQLRKDGLDHVLVTRVDGVLLGRVVMDDLHV